MKATLLVAAVLALISTSPGEDKSNAETAKPISIQLGIAESKDGKPPSTFSVTLQNSSGEAKSVVLGMMLGNGRQLFPLNVHFTVTDSAGVKEEFEVQPPAGVAGRVDPYIVPLEAGALHRLNVPFKKVISTRTQLSIDRLPPGDYHVSATLVPLPEDQKKSPAFSVAWSALWSGQASSQEIRLQRGKK